MAGYLAAEWSDVTPIPQNDGPHPVVPIAYAPSFVRCMDLFRAVLASGETSLRALRLTAEVIDENAANYTAWQYRRKCLVALDADLEAELAFIEGVAGDSPKNYQLWFHRREVVSRLGQFGREAGFVAAVHAEDAKNYHAWSHLQWVAAQTGDYAAQMGYVEQRLERDVRNNSAWNHRWFLVHGIHACLGDDPALLPVSRPLPPAVAAEEADVAIEKLGIAFNNESPWLYLRAVLREQRGADHAEAPELHSRSEARVVEPAEGTSNQASRHLLAFRLDLREAELAAASEAPADPVRVEVALGLVEGLLEVDATRRNYWLRRKQRLEAL